MGSGLILLVIVGAWLAVLVPMALRSHEATSLGTVDKFHDAMRVLSRREAAELAQDEGDELPDEQAAEQAAVRSLAVRRRRILLALLALAMGTLLAALVGPRWLFAPHLVAGLAFAGYVGHLRVQARWADHEALAARSQLRIERRAAEAAEVAARARELLSPSAPVSVPVVRRAGRPMRIAGVPDRMPTRVALGATPRPTPVERAEPAAELAIGGELVATGPAATGPAVPTAPAPAPVPADAPATSARLARSDRAARPEGASQTGLAARTRRAAPAATAAVPAAPAEEKAQRAQPPAARGAQGGAWLPVPVPPPIYLSAPPAPRRRPRPSEDDEAAATQEPAVEEVADEQRAVND